MFQLLRTPRYAALAVIAIAIAVGCASAGVWQAHRYDWKRGENHVLRDNDHIAPAPVGQVLSPTSLIGKDEQFRRITATGRYDGAGQFVVRQREVNDGPAFLVVTPMRTVEGPDLLVVRGWVAMTDAASKTPRIAAPPTGTVQVSGRVYPSEPGKRAAGLPRGQVDRLDVPAIAGTLGRPTYGGYVELTGSTPAQHGLSSLPGPDLSNPAGGAYELQHLAYVFQWFIFAIIALLAPYILMRIETRRGNDGGPERPEIAAPVANHST